MRHNFKRYCKEPENIENYQKAKADNFKGWDCHHRLETHNSDGERRLVDITVAELQALGMYYNRPPEELIFLRKGEHTALRKVSDSTKKKLSDIGKGRPKPEEARRKMKGNKNALGHSVSDEARKRMSESHKGKDTWTKGRLWVNNGKINKRAYECPEGFVPGRLR